VISTHAGRSSASIRRSSTPALLTFDSGRATQKSRYGGELFPAETAADRHGTRFIDFFQRDKDTGAAKGIIGIDLGGLP
jgi:hypothetical protein